MRHSIPAFALLLACTLPSWSTASTPAGRAALEQFSQGLQSLDGRFVQVVRDAEGRLDQRSEGRIALKAPRQFRWEYQRPYQQLIVADGNHVWLFDPDLDQVTVRAQSFEEQASPLAVLIDAGELDRQFVVSEGGRADGLVWVDLKARRPEDSAVQNARLGFSADGLMRMVFEDQLGKITDIAFQDWSRNPRLAADLFRFTPPPGVDVVGELRQQAEVRPLQE